MKKLALNLEDLSVESFSTTGKEAGRGTVRGHDYTEWDCGTVPREYKTLNNCYETTDCDPNNTQSQYWSCVCTPSGQYTCAC